MNLYIYAAMSNMNNIIAMSNICLHPLYQHIPGFMITAHFNVIIFILKRRSNAAHNSIPKAPSIWSSIPLEYRTLGTRRQFKIRYKYSLITKINTRRRAEGLYVGCFWVGMLSMVYVLSNPIIIRKGVSILLHRTTTGMLRHILKLSKTLDSF